MDGEREGGQQREGGAAGQPLVLAVDDDPDMLRLVGLALKGLPIRLETRSQAFGILNAVAELRPALVVLDVMMPGLDGVQLTALVREDPQLSRTAVLLYSALEEKDLAARARACGADGWLTKTAGPRALATEVRRRLGL